MKTVLLDEIRCSECFLVFPLKSIPFTVRLGDGWVFLCNGCYTKVVAVSKRAVGGIGREVVAALNNPTNSI